MDYLVKIGESFINLINTGAETLIGMAKGILPAALIALVLMNTLVKLIGQEKVENFARRANRNILARYLFLPYLSNFFFSNPTAFMIGKFLPEKYKPGYYEAVNSGNMAPMMCLFPHVNPAELYVWLGVADGVTKLGLPVAPLAIRVFLIGIFTTTLKAVTIEQIANYLAKRKGFNWEEIETKKEKMSSMM
ncbi:PTS glucitol/sorbitol transporter subunit IIC [Thermoanaerobacteraceae bacterium SP2]|nr:PTS glucitol/sorbitol transporter subunit IIC [Thermoanaerobacteraceae bacterium SP2]